MGFFLLLMIVLLLPLLRALSVTFLHGLGLGNLLFIKLLFWAVVSGLFFDFFLSFLLLSSLLLSSFLDGGWARVST